MKNILLIAFVLAVMANTAAGDMMYALTSTAPGGGVASAAPTYLHYFDDNNPGVVTNLGKLTVNDNDVDADALAWSRTYGLLAFSVQTGQDKSQMLALDPATVTATAVGSLYDERDIRGAVFDAADNFWAADAAGDELLRINPANGDIWQSVGLWQSGAAFDLGTSTDIAVARDGTFYIVNTGQFYTVDMGTGIVSLQHDIPSLENNLPGLAFSTDGPDDLLFGYEVNGSDDIFTYDIGNGYSSAVFASGFTNENAGRGDLASITPVPAPAAVLLGMLGLSVAGVKLRKYA